MRKLPQMLCGYELSIQQCPLSGRSVSLAVVYLGKDCGTSDLPRTTTTAHRAAERAASKNVYRTATTMMRKVNLLVVCPHPTRWSAELVCLAACPCPQTDKLSNITCFAPFMSPCDPTKPSPLDSGSCIKEHSLSFSTMHISNLFPLPISHSFIE
jgi:hypothetical protein